MSAGLPSESPRPHLEGDRAVIKQTFALNFFTRDQGGNGAAIHRAEPSEGVAPQSATDAHFTHVRQ